jgi:putative ABC transport system substrate-binding protein
MFDPRRRQFITLLGGAAAWPLAARAEQSAKPVVGFLGAGSPNLFAARLSAFHVGLSEAGYVEGHNVAIEYRWADDQYDRLPALAAELARRQVAVIAVPGSTPGALAAKSVTRTIPIVFYVAVDPVEAGLVGSLNRPGDNLTGASSLNADLAPKALELLHELVPAATSLALLVNPTNDRFAATFLREARMGARKLGLQLHVVRAGNVGDFDEVFARLGDLGVGALVISSDPFFTSQCERLAALSLHHAVPALYQYREFPAAGGLMSYGGSTSYGYRLVGIYTGRILKGEKPADLPVQQATRIELTINLRTAKALGLELPATLLARADEVIE